jgi:hypothetical protein
MRLAGKVTLITGAAAVSKDNSWALVGQQHGSLPTKVPGWC